MAFVNQPRNFKFKRYNEKLNQVLLKMAGINPSSNGGNNNRSYSFMSKHDPSTSTINNNYRESMSPPPIMNRSALM